MITLYDCLQLQVAWTSFHNNKALSRKYMAAYHIGHIVEEEKEVNYKNRGTQNSSRECSYEISLKDFNIKF